MSEREKALEALLPCPFCGDPMKHGGHGEVIHINGDRCIIGKNRFFVAAWNTRAALAMPATVDRAAWEAGRDAAKKAAGDYCWQRTKEAGVLKSPAVFTTHTWQDIQQVIANLTPSEDKI